MTDKNVWDEPTEEISSGDWVKWVKGKEPFEIGLGESIKGILRDVYEKQQTQGGMQKIYTIETKEGEKYNVGSRGEIFDRMMQDIVIGQIVEFKYVEDIKSKTPGNSPFKLIKPYAGVIVDEQPAKTVEENSPFDN